MIEIKIKYSENVIGIQTIEKITVSGHATNDKGRLKELCASVSMATTVTANAITFLSLDDDVVIERSSGYFNIEMKNINSIVAGLLENIRYTLESLKEQFPDYIEEIVVEGLIENKENFDVSKINIDEGIAPELALLTIGHIPLEIPDHPHLSMSKESIQEVQKAYKIIQAALGELKDLKQQSKSRSRLPKPVDKPDE